MLLDEVKAFLRVYDDHSDALIQAMIDSASELVEGSTGRKFDNEPEEVLERMCIKLLVRHWYDNEQDDVPYGIQTIMTQLEY